MSESRVRQWCIDFKNGHTSVNDEDRSDRSSLVTDDLAMQINDKILENCCFTIIELSEHFPQISWSLEHQIVVEKLGYHKFCARWVPKILMEDHKKQRLATALTFLQEYSTNGNAVLDRIVTGNDTWVKHVNCETK
ncbi:histone-lysine N-methyltransferase SETMAR-like [Halyomorpha halys]|uniref:histone-lysine N-methyltransferase SETMAR-like n=1 Tax=Halyomorpha halys TaxID=286706 RepID=UPI0006D509D2